MDDSEREPFSSAASQEERKNWTPMAAGGALVLVAIAIIVLLSRGGRPAAPNPGDPNLAKIQLSNLHMATAQNFAGSSVTYIEGKLTNAGDRKITAAQVEVLFKNSLGETAQKEGSLA